jgi:UDP-2,3-diacylglucosamine hydrolase
MEHQVAEALKSLSETGVDLYFMAGNRDFLVGEDYCRHAGLVPLAEPFRVDDNILSAVLMHGDTLCTDDHAYQRFRRKVRNPVWQQRVLSRPLWWRRILAGLARSISRRQNRNKPEAIMDVNAQAVIDTFREHDIDCLIHGHTHRPAIHELKVDGRPCRRVVLGDWHGERGSVVRIEDGQIELLDLRRDSQGKLALSSKKSP